MQKSHAAALAAVFMAAALTVGPGTAGADPSHPGGCPAYGQFMGTSASNSAQNQHPLGQAVRQLTPFDQALAVFKTDFCGG